MRSIFNYKVALLGLTALGFSACDQDKDVDAPMDANTKPVITVTRIGENTGAVVNEGDILEFQVESSKFMEGAVSFDVEVEGAIEGVDYEVLSTPTIQPYSTSTTFEVLVISDNFPENDAEYGIRVVSTGLDQNWRLNPSSLEGTTFTIGVKNINPAGAFTVGFMWSDDHDDFDIYVLDSDGEPLGEDIYEGATGNFPEVSTVLKTDAPNGEYHVTIDPYSVGHDQVPFTVSVGKPDHSSQVFTGTIDLTSEELPTFEGMIAVLKIVKSGDNITVTQLIN